MVSLMLVQLMDAVYQGGQESKDVVYVPSAKYGARQVFVY